VLLVNTASACGYTNQYAELQQLWEQYRDRLLVVGFPANDFKEQEKGNDEEIAQFCQLNFGVNFPLSKKTTVIPGNQQHPVYQWLTDKSRNGWNEQAPGWNFSKYLVDEEGRLLGYFEAGVSPLSETIKELIEK
jgi:glutathione peroxidase